MGKTADLKMVQKTIIDTLHKEKGGCSQSALSMHKKLGRKMYTSNRDDRLRILSSKADSNTSQGVD